MKFQFFVLICLLGAYRARARLCEAPTELSGLLTYDETSANYFTTRGYYNTKGYTRDYGNTRGYFPEDKKCWFIRVPEDHYVRLSVKEMDMRDPYCDYLYVEVEDSAGWKNKICQAYSDQVKWTNTLLGDLTITVKMKDGYNYWSRNGYVFKMRYQMESIACARNDSFRCSVYKCIYSSQVCDGKIDCSNGIDENACEIPAIKGVNASRIQGINWLKSRLTDLGWGRNTHRAITALYLSGASRFQGAKIEEELMVKELQLKTVAALLRNTTSLLSVNELSMYVNSLMVTCHDIHNFYGHDLLKALSSRAFTSSSPSPGAYLTLCNADWRFSQSSVRHLIRLLERNAGNPFALEIKAMAVMALTCMRFKTNFNVGWLEVYLKAMENIMLNQKPDGSFGNAHTTAMITQALISCNQQNNTHWKYDSAVQYLMKNVNSSSADFLSVYLSLPIFNGKTLMDIGRVDCSEYQRKFENDDDDVSELIDTLGGNTSVQYSLFIGNNKEIVHTIYLKVSENSTAFDVMNLAQLADHKYKFSFNRAQDHIYIYKIGGMSNDMEVGKFWLLYKTDSESNTLRERYTTSADDILINSGDHLVMWYKMADF